MPRIETPSHSRRIKGSIIGRGPVLQRLNQLSTGHKVRKIRETTTEVGSHFRSSANRHIVKQSKYNVKVVEKVGYFIPRWSSVSNMNIIES